MINNLAGKNIESPIIYLKHSDLERVSDSLFKSSCPICKRGVLLVHRHPKTFLLEEFDHCVLCGQRFIYTDIQLLKNSVGE